MAIIFQVALILCVRQTINEHTMTAPEACFGFPFEEIEQHMDNKDRVGFKMTWEGNSAKTKGYVNWTFCFKDDEGEEHDSMLICFSELDGQILFFHYSQKVYG